MGVLSQRGVAGVEAGPSYSQKIILVLLKVFKVQIFFEFDCFPTDKFGQSCCKVKNRASSAVKNELFNDPN